MAAFAPVPVAQAATLYACVTKSGTAHVYTKKPKKCKSKKEKLVSWNTVGPAGKNGTDGTNGASGTNGTNGTNGAVAGYFASGLGKDTPLSESDKTVLSKTLPAGRFLITAKAVVIALGTKAGLVGAQCRLLEGAAEFDLSFFDLETAEFGAGSFYGAVPLTLVGEVSLTAPASITLQCVDYDDRAGGTVEAREPELMAVEVSSIG